MIKIGIVGGTGYTGVELLRILAAHPQAELVAITSRKEDGMPVADMYPSLRGHVSLAFSAPAYLVTPEEMHASNDAPLQISPRSSPMKDAPLIEVITPKLPA